MRACSYCWTEVAGNFRKCKACGEWAEGRWHVGGGGVVALALLWVVATWIAYQVVAVQPGMVRMFAEVGAELPVATRLVLTPIPGVACVLLAMAVAAALLVIPMKERLRTLLLTADLLALIVVAGAMRWALLLPMRMMASAIAP